jgi:hypothetical protein
MASRSGGCLHPCPCPHAGTLGRPDRSSCGGQPANLDPIWACGQYPDELGFPSSRQVRRRLLAAKTPAGEVERAPRSAARAMR